MPCSLTFASLFFKLSPCCESTKAEASLRSVVKFMASAKSLAEYSTRAIKSRIFLQNGKKNMVCNAIMPNASICLFVVSKTLKSYNRKTSLAAM